MRTLGTIVFSAAPLVATCGPATIFPTLWLTTVFDQDSGQSSLKFPGLPVSDSADKRLGIAMERHNVRHIALAHHIYHSLKLGHEHL